MFPLFLNLTGRLVVVIGGGAVGRRKASAALDAGARVRLVCLEPRPPEETDSALDWRTEPYDPSHLDGATLVFAAGPPDLNARVTAEARVRGIWVNSATDPAAGDFILPATLRRDNLVIAVGTGGAAPALARAVCRRLEPEFDDAFGAWVGLLAELRPWVLERVADPERRRDVLERWCAWEWLERLRRQGVDSVRAALRAEVEALGPPPSAGGSS